jgi:hypothetical protein
LHGKATGAASARRSGPLSRQGRVITLEGRHSAGPVVVGWKEYVALPEWGIRRLKAKIDTGARTSAIDATGYELRETAAGLVVRMRLPLSRRHPERLTVVEAPVLRMLAVCNSGGLREDRPLVEALLRLGPVTRRIRLTVASRAGMRFRLILGRKALEGDFVVDVSRKYLCGRRH